MKNSRAFGSASLEMEIRPGLGIAPGQFGEVAQQLSALLNEQRLARALAGR